MRRTAIGILGGVGFALCALAMAAPASALGPVNANNAEQVSNYLMDKGTKALREKKYDDAIALFEQSVTAYPRNATAFGRLGEAYGEKGEHAKARKFYDIALSIEPDDLTILLRAGQAALQEDDMDGARAQLDRLKTICKARCGEYRSLDGAIKAKEAAKKTAEAEKKDAKSAPAPK